MHPVEKGLYAAVMPEMEIIGEVTKIGRNSLVFTYYPTGHKEIQNALVDIFAETGSPYLENIPCRITLKPGRGKHSLHQCRIHYNALSSSQQAQVDELIERFAVSA